MIELRTVQSIITPIEEVEILIHQADRRHPVPHLPSLVRIRLIASIHRQPRSNVEETTIRNGVLIIVPIIEVEDLPLQPTTTRRRIPSRDLGIEHSLRQREPTRRPIRRIRILILSRRHSRHPPKRLIVIPLSFRLVRRHIIVIWTDLMQHGLGGDVVPGIVACEIPVIDHGTEHGAGFPPVVWCRKVSWYIAVPIAGIVLHHA